MKTMQSNLQQDILEELRSDPSLDSSRIGVAVEKGVVDLGGHVRTFAERLAAEQAVKRVRGVTTVANELQVDLLHEHKRGDVELAKAAHDALCWNVTVPNDKVTVTVSKGWITLEGEVPFAYQRSAATRAVESLTGVVGVTNKVTIQPQVSASNVYRKLSAALHRYAQLEVDAIKAKVEGNKVVLDGTVHSWAERDLVQEAAWNAPGVAHVDNHLTVNPL